MADRERLTVDLQQVAKSVGHGCGAVKQVFPQWGSLATLHSGSRPQVLRTTAAKVRFDVRRVGFRDNVAILKEAINLISF